MTKYPKISVVVLNYNGLTYLKRTIRSLLNLKYPNYELIVVDNGSNDKSVDYLKNIKQIRLIENKKNLGYSKGKNLGVNRAKGKYILFLDDDILIKDVYVLNKILKVYLRLKTPAIMSILLVNDNETKTKLYGARYDLFGIIPENEPKQLNKIKKYNPYFFETTLCNGGAMFFEKEIWKKVGGLDESQPFNLDDDDISTRAVIFGYKNYIYTEVVARHLGKARRINNDDSYWKYKYFFSGKSRSMFKNLEFKTLVWAYPFFILKVFLLTLKNAVFRLDLRIFYALFFSVFIFVKDFHHMLEERERIQKNRKVHDSESLYRLNLR